MHTGEEAQPEGEKVTGYHRLPWRSGAADRSAPLNTVLYAPLVFIWPSAPYVVELVVVCPRSCTCSFTPALCCIAEC